MSVPSCPLALTNPIQLHTLRCSEGPYAPKSSHRHAKTCLFPSRYQFDMSFTYIDELILAQVAAGNIRQILRESRSNLRQTDRLLARAATTGAILYPWQPVCLRTCMLRCKCRCSSLPFHRSVQKNSPHTSGLDDYKQNILAVLFCRSHCKCPQRSQFL